LEKIQNFPGSVGTLKKKRKVTVTVTKTLSATQSVDRKQNKVILITKDVTD